MLKIEIVYTKANEQAWHFRIKSPNGRILCSSEQYVRRSACEKTVKLLQSQLARGSYVVVVDHKAKPIK